MAKKVGKIAKEKKPFDKTYIPLTFAFIILALLVGALVYTIIQKPKDKPVMNETNTLQIEEVVVNNKMSTVCTNDEIERLTDEAKKITAKYEEIDNFVFDGCGQNYASESGSDVCEQVTGYAIRVSIENISSDLYLLVRNNIDDSNIMTSSNLPNNKYTWDEGNTFYVRKYAIDVYSDSEACKGVKIRSFDFSIPKWNEASKMGVCNNNEFKDIEQCKHFTYDESSFGSKITELNEKVDKRYKEIEKEKSNKKDTINDFINNNKIIIIIAITVLIIGVVVLIVVLKRRSNNEK